MNSLVFGLALLFNLLVVKSQIFESSNVASNSVFLDAKDTSCSPDIPTYDVLIDTSITLFCPFKPVEWIYRTKPIDAWKYNFLTVERQYFNFTIEKAVYDGCVCCRSILDFSLSCLHVRIETPPMCLTCDIEDNDDEVKTYCDKPFDIECPYSGYPELNYTWIFLKYFSIFPKVIEENNPQIEDQLHNRTLHFDKYSSSMRGTYKCIAENKYGKRGNFTVIDGIAYLTKPKFSTTAPEDCRVYKPLFSADLSNEYTAEIGGNVTMSCNSQYGCQFIEDCLKNIEWDESAFPPDRTIKINGSLCSTCTNYKNRTIFNLKASDFDKTYACNITSEYSAYPYTYSTRIKQASRNTQSFNPLPALLPTVLILLTLIILTTTSIILGIHYKRKITMFFYYRLAKEPPYVKGLQYDVFISFASLDKDFVEEKIHNRIKDSGYKVIWYPDDFLAGDVILQQAKDSIWKSRKTIMCLSENFLASDYCGAEKEYCFEKAMETFKNFLIVIHLDNCEIPSDMKKLKIIDMKMNSSDNHLKPFSNVKYLLKAPVDNIHN